MSRDLNKSKSYLKLEKWCRMQGKQYIQKLDMMVTCTGKGKTRQEV